MTAGWRELYDAEYPRLLRALLAIGGDSDAAEDAAQEAFVRAYRTGLERLERPGAWLLVVGTHELFRGRRRRRIEAQRWTERAAHDAGVDTVAERVDLLAALRQLPERQRTVVVARYYYGLSYDEIARLFSIKSGTVAATLHQAIERLRQLQITGRVVRGTPR